MSSNFSWEDYYVTNRATPWGTPNGGGHRRVRCSTASRWTPTPRSRHHWSTSSVVDQTAYTAFDRLYHEGELYWRVQAIDSDGNGLTWSAPLGQKINKATHAARDRDPAADSQVEGTVPLRWNAQAFVSSYDVEVYKGDDPNFSAGNRVFAANRIKTNAYVSDTPAAARPGRRTAGASASGTPTTTLVPGPPAASS